MPAFKPISSFGTRCRQSIHFTYQQLLGPRLDFGTVSQFWRGRQLAAEMKRKKPTKRRMAELMQTSRAQLDRLLDPDNGSATIESLQRAAKIVGRELRLELV
jgi:hypothetical protein